MDTPLPPTRSRGAASGVSATCLVLLTVLLVARQQQQLGTHDLAALWLVGAMFIVYVVGSAALQRVSPTLSVRLAVGGGAVLQLVALRTRPLGTDDYLRYAWDGRVQAAGIDPYRYPPGAPQLAALRDAWLFPDGVTPRLNHPGDRTIYPPVAQAWFWLVDVVTGGGGQGRGLQVGAAVLALLTSVAIVVVLRRRGSDIRGVAWWAWCPTVVIEAGGNAHVDVLGALLTVAALGLLADRRWRGGGLVLGLAVATKLLPALVAVGVPPRRSLRVGLAALAALGLVYLPHVLVLGTDVTGFLGGYLREESTDRFALLRAVLPDVVVRPVGWGLLVVTALVLWRRAERDDRAGAPPRPWVHGAAMVGVTYLLIEPAYPWYALLLVPLVALGAPRRWLAVAAAPYLVYAAVLFGHAYAGTRVVGYGAAALVVAVVALWDRRGAVAAWSVAATSGRRGSAAAPDRGR
ncbi:MAG TPA: glycosyltransferase family 87 protein [Angustibacter sp.]|nr:glycosyltransferase family 87 protein [Angustibacter sp.]